MQEPMHQRHLADDQLQVTRSDTPEPSAQDQDHPTANRVHHSRTQTISNISESPGESEDDGDVPPLDPPPSYEQSISAPPASTAAAGSSRSNPFLDQPGRTSSQRTGGVSLTESPNHTMNTPGLASRHAPSAPPLTLLTTSSSTEPRDHTGRARTTEADGHLSFASSSTSTSTIRRGKRPVRNSSHPDVRDEDEQIFRAQPAMSPSYLHPSVQASSISSSSVQDGHFSHQQQQQGHVSSTSPNKHSRTSQRLQHKQDFARHAATAPELYPQPQQQQYHHDPRYASQPSLVPLSTAASLSPQPMLSLSQSVVPAPPPRLLQFRSQEPSAVPACPFLLCQKPIAFTKTRRERGVTVWIVCGILFLCNTYWTTHVLIDHFSSPTNRGDGRVLSKEAADIAASGFSARGEAGHLVKGLLGFKTYRSKEPTFRNYQRHQSAMQRPTIATVGVVQDEQSAIRMVLSFLMLAVMAILRWWLCLSPLLVRPLFDTVHSCPHEHPYPYPEEIEQERMMIEEMEGVTEEQLREQEQEHQQQEDPLDPDYYDGDEKKRLRQQELEEVRVKSRSGRHGRRHNKETTESEFTTSAKAPQDATDMADNPVRDDTVADPSHETITATTTTSTTAGSSELSTESVPPPRKSRFKFFQRLRAIRQQRQQEGREAIVETVQKFQRKKLYWRTRRLLAKAQARRQAIIKASQDIGRYSLLYGLGYWFMADRWKQAVLAPGKLKAEAYED
ncbi:hypothetical protein BGZ83_001951 [Gryganskiella cystojenkinii]|nr:hypothetical protein BGZ83_001951 [Gryganskiella cystojenkinii]